MKIQEKPDYLIFAESAKKGEVSDFPDVSRGWGITIEQTGSKPPLEWMNGAFNRVDKNMLYLLQQGVPEWSEKVTYPVNAIIKYNGVLYTAIDESDNAIPSTNTTKWKKTQAEISLSSAVDSKSTEIAANSLAVKTVNEKIEDIKKIYQYDEDETRFYSPLRDMRFVVRNDGISGIYSSSLNNGKGGFIWSFNKKGELDGKIEAKNIINLSSHIPSLSSAVDSTSETKAATSLAVKTVNDKVDSAHQRITDVHNIVNGITSRFQYDDFESRVYSSDKEKHFVIRNDGISGIYSKKDKGFLWSFNERGELDGKLAAGNIMGLGDYIKNMFSQNWTDRAGFMRLPNGMIIQWGFCEYLASMGYNGTVHSFYTTFPSKCLSIVCSDWGQGANSISATPLNNSQFNSWAKSLSGRLDNSQFYYVAIGV